MSVKMLQTGGLRQASGIEEDETQDLIQAEALAEVQVGAQVAALPAERS